MSKHKHRYLLLAAFVILSILACILPMPFGGGPATPKVQEQETPELRLGDIETEMTLR
jgi:hypothetical protein